MSTTARSDSGAVRANGIDIHYRIDGADGPWVVLAHALGVDHQLWDGIAARLSDRHRVLRYDARGHGKTTAPHGAYTLFQMADDVFGLLDALSIAQVHFIGLSMGGMVGQILGVRHPQRLLSLTLCDTVCYTPVSAHAMWDERIGQVEAHGMSGIVEPTIQRWLTTPFREAHPDAVERIRALLRATPPHGYVGACLAIKALDTRGSLERIACPTLVMTGDQDTGAPVEVAREIASHIPNARLKVMSRAAHLAPIEQDEAFLTALDEFLGHAGCGSQCDTP
ncbi:3-oxoadipate enol-lactonase [Ralstonia mannitolilytica]|uniref:3-oxoadipate enol-lactonase 2 n=1 Tax=Ralstonia mannitolilytica TaxID=105219 RepID=A0AAD2EN67_9RALS|nr:3-oxoadipate enol-lactonase [Ralstonia mannitolilytica]MBY4720112.1 3-oxoadipate enol-lactonase [Ralstonia mannitolilytica]CAJ0690714.1 3-oxoadipate enol-lactonase 2 [Ralstonia mannitolilytica]CAJ0703864.1 3-oxoadipate enol-lactonase 2 [Ralstonia mannitolilytica]CAJ0711315.1 3-oxoadipate enol-lactonase 2 [Ralstonia mannitolilytica]CAJ0882282.1 3-oxoadipate enol-lactonase 2 [Ralstonia mannitolilytica]